MMNYFQELEKDTTDKVASHFQCIDDVLYASENYPDQNTRTNKIPSDPGNGSVGERRTFPSPDPSAAASSSSLSKELQLECKLWRKAFPHLRYVRFKFEYGAPIAKRI